MSSSDGWASISPASSCARREVGLDRLAEPAQAVVAHREPHLQCPEPPRKLHRFFEEREPFDGILGHGLRVIAGVGEGLGGDPPVAIQQRAAVDGLVQPFVQVE
jgi:hypothetical protein